MAVVTPKESKLKYKREEEELDIIKPVRRLYVQDKHVWSEAFFQLNPHKVLQHFSMGMSEELCIPGNSSQFQVEKHRPYKLTPERTDIKERQEF